MIIIFHEYILLYYNAIINMGNYINHIDVTLKYFNYKIFWHNDNYYIDTMLKY